MRRLGKSPWERNPRFCRLCMDWLRKMGAGGAEVELGLVFADVRGSTTLASQMSPREYGQLINRFFTVATQVFVRHDAIIDQLVGDEVIGLFLPGYAGPTYLQRAIEASRALLQGTGHGSKDGPWLPLGVGVHTGVAYVGAVGSEESFTDFTALGDPVITASRLASAAQAGEILVSQHAQVQAKLDVSGNEWRTLTLKGKTEAVRAVAIR